MVNVLCFNEDHFARLDMALCLLANKKVYRHTPEPWFLQPKQYIINCLLTSTPLTIVFYWGISPRGFVSNTEINAFEFIAYNINSLADILRTTWTIDCIFTDTHGFVNGLSEATIDSYCNSVINALSDNRRGFFRMTDVLGIAHDKNVVLELSSEIIKQHDLFNKIPKHIIDELTNNARNHSVVNLPDFAAKSYVAISHIESPIIRQKFSGSLQLTYQPPHMAWLLPALPTLHMYVGENHERRRPWFDCGRELVNCEK